MLLIQQCRKNIFQKHLKIIPETFQFFVNLSYQLRLNNGDFSYVIYLHF